MEDNLYIEVKEYLKIDEDNESELKPIIDAAKIYIQNAGVKNIPGMETNELYVLAVKLLVGHWYENRESVTIGGISKKLEFSLDAILTQLLYSYDYEV